MQCFSRSLQYRSILRFCPYIKHFYMEMYFSLLVFPPLDIGDWMNDINLNDFQEKRRRKNKAKLQVHLPLVSFIFFNSFLFLFVVIYRFRHSRDILKGRKRGREYRASANRQQTGRESKGQILFRTANCMIAYVLKGCGT